MENLELFESRKNRGERFKCFLHKDTPKIGRSLEMNLRKLETLMIKELRALGDVAALEHYIELEIVPQRLRWDLEIHEGDESQETKTFWNEFFNDCGLLLLKTLVERKKQRLNILNKEIKELEGVIRPHNTTEVYKNLASSIKTKLDREENDIKQRKHRKLKRDMWEYKTEQIYKRQKKTPMDDGIPLTQERPPRREFQKREVERSSFPLGPNIRQPTQIPPEDIRGRIYGAQQSHFRSEGRDPKEKIQSPMRVPPWQARGWRSRPMTGSPLEQRHHWRHREMNQTGGMRNSFRRIPQENRPGKQTERALTPQREKWQKEACPGPSGMQVKEARDQMSPGNKKRKLREEGENEGV